MACLGEKGFKEERLVIYTGTRKMVYITDPVIYKLENDTYMYISTNWLYILEYGIYIYMYIYIYIYI